MRVVKRFSNLSASVSSVRGDFFLREKVTQHQRQSPASIGKSLARLLMVAEADFAERVDG
jgi:hypothetical protein